jgi:hypothetical protein
VTAREKVRAAAAANGWKLHQLEDEYVDQFKKGRRSVRVVTDTYGRLTLVTTDTHRFGGSGKLDAALSALSATAKK